MKWSPKALQALATATNPQYVECFGRLYGQGMGAVMNVPDEERHIVMGYLNRWERCKWKYAFPPSTSPVNTFSKGL